MGKACFVTCPKCGFRYPVGETLVKRREIPTLCPKCHYTYQPEESVSGIEK